MQSNNWSLLPRPPPCLGDKGSKFTRTNTDKSLARHNCSRARVRLQVKLKNNTATAPAQDSTDNLINREFQSQTIGLGDNTILCHGHLLINFMAVISYQRGFVNSTMTQKNGLIFDTYRDDKVGVLLLFVFRLFFFSISAHIVIGTVMVLAEVTYKTRETVQLVRRFTKDCLYK